MSNQDNLNSANEELKRYESGVTAFLISGLICLVLGIITIKALIGAGLVLLFLATCGVVKRKLFVVKLWNRHQFSLITSKSRVGVTELSCRHPSEQYLRLQYRQCFLL